MIIHAQSCCRRTAGHLYHPLGSSSQHQPIRSLSCQLLTWQHCGRRLGPTSAYCTPSAAYLTFLPLVVLQLLLCCCCLHHLPLLQSMPVCTPPAVARHGWLAEVLCVVQVPSKVRAAVLILSWLLCTCPQPPQLCSLDLAAIRVAGAHIYIAVPLAAQSKPGIAL